MTSETRTSITPSDIKAIELICKTCHVRTIRPLDSWQDNEKCSNCTASWPIKRQISFTALSHLARALNELAKIKDDDQDVPFLIRLELTENLPKVRE
jgi:uncharacterized SAM-binding protein YcdF (DUF218 family)